MYNPCKTMISSYLDHLSNCVDNCLPKYDNFIILGDFNSEMTETELSNFCEVYNMKNLVKEPTCYKSLENPSCIDLILTNRPKQFYKTEVAETGLSD